MTTFRIPLPQQSGINAATIALVGVLGILTLAATI